MNKLYVPTVTTKGSGLIIYKNQPYTSAVAANAAAAKLYDSIPDATDFGVEEIDTD